MWRQLLEGRPRRLLAFANGARTSFECLVLAKIGDRQAKWVEGDQLVRNAVLKDEDEIRGIEVAFQLGAVGGGVVNKVEVHASAIILTSTSISGAAVLVRNLRMMSSLR